MTEPKEKGGFLNLIAGLFATLALTAHGCQKLFKTVDNVHIPIHHVEIPANPPKITGRSYSKPPTIPVIPKPRSYSEPGFPNTHSYSGPRPPKPPVIPRLPSDIVVPNINLSDLNINWSDPNVRNVKAVTDNTARNAARRAKESHLVGEAKEKFILEATHKAGYQEKNKLSRKKIVIPDITVDIIIATSVHQTLEENNKEQSMQKS